MLHWKMSKLNAFTYLLYFRPFTMVPTPLTHSPPTPSPIVPHTSLLLDLLITDPSNSLILTIYRSLVLIPKTKTGFDLQAPHLKWRSCPSQWIIPTQLCPKSGSCNVELDPVRTSVVTLHSIPGPISLPSNLASVSGTEPYSTMLKWNYVFWPYPLSGLKSSTPSAQIRGESVFIWDTAKTHSWKKGGKRQILLVSKSARMP